MHLTVLSALVATVLGSSSVGAAVVYARRKADGTFNSTLKVRETCKPSEVQLAVFSANPWLVGLAPTSTTSTTGATPTTSPGGTTTTTSTLPGTPVCGNGVIEAGEVCDCGFQPCHSDPNQTVAINQGGCPQQPDGAIQECQNDCQACVPAPGCGDAHFEPGDTCDYAFGVQNDQCPSGSRCILTNPCRCFPLRHRGSNNSIGFGRRGPPDARAWLIAECGLGRSSNG